MSSVVHESVEPSSTRAHSRNETSGPQPWTESPLGTVFALGVDALALSTAFGVGYLLRFQWLPGTGSATPVAAIDPYMKALVIGVYATLALFHAAGLYRHRMYRDEISLISSVVRAIAVSLILIAAVGYFYRGFSYSRLSVFYTGTAAIVFAGGFRLAWERYRIALRSRAEYRVPTLVLGSAEEAQRLVERLESETDHGYRLCGAECIDGSLDETSLLASIEAFGVREILIADASLSHHDLLGVLELSERRGVTCRMVPATYDLLVQSSDFSDVDGLPLVTINERRHRPIEAALKRVTDLTLAVLGGIAVAPVVLVAALWVRLDSAGSVFFGQTRIGRDGKPFTMWKLRSMTPNAEAQLETLVTLESLAEPVFKLDADPRVTRAGRVLRRWSIDELPQLWNVIRGEMSLVGPRPEEARVVSIYDVWERRRLKAKPGITGLQQIHCRGSQSLAERVRWDVLYVRRQSLVLDMVILGRTLFTVVRGKGAR